MSIHTGFAMLDSLVNLVTGIGTPKDATVSSHWHLHVLDRSQLEKAYRGDWIARRIVDAPAQDSTREWRNWQAAQDQIEKIEEVETKFYIQKKLKQALIRARLYGGAALVVGVDDGLKPDQPLDYTKLKAGCLQFVVVLNRYELSAGPRIYDVESEWYTRPQYYTIATPLYGFQPTAMTAKAAAAAAPLSDPLMAKPYSGAMVDVHPSRVVELAGNELPDWRLAPLGGGWGDSILQTVDDALKDWTTIISSMAAGASDMKMDVLKIPQFAKRLANKDYSSALIDRFALANMAKSIVNTLMIDSEEEWSRIETNMGGWPQLIREMMVVVAGAGGIPVSRLMGQAPGRGLSASGTSGGEQDLKNYYDGINNEQETVLRPALEPLDKCIIISALGKDDPNVFYEWAPLYQQDPKEIAQIALQKAQAFQIDVNVGVINEDVLRTARVNQLIEDKTYPGLEDAVEEFGAEPQIIEARVWSPGVDPVTGKTLQVAGPPPGSKGGAGGGGTGGAGGSMGGAGSGASAPKPTPLLTNVTRDAWKGPGYDLAANVEANYAEILARLRDYSPDQPRNPKGEWTSGGYEPAGGYGVTGSAGKDAELARAIAELAHKRDLAGGGTPDWFPDYYTSQVDPATSEPETRPPGGKDYPWFPGYMGAQLDYIDSPAAHVAINGAVPYTPEADEYKDAADTPSTQAIVLALKQALPVVGHPDPDAHAVVFAARSAIRHVAEYVGGQEEARKALFVAGNALISANRDDELENVPLRRFVGLMRKMRGSTKDYSPDQPRDPSGRWTAGFSSAAQAAQFTGFDPSTGTARAPAGHFMDKVKEFMADERGGDDIGRIASAAAAQIPALAAHVSHEVVKQELKSAVRDALTIGLAGLGAHLAGPVAGMAVGVAASMAVNHLSHKVGLTPENAHHVLVAVTQHLVTHYHAIMGQESLGHLAGRAGHLLATGAADAGEDDVLSALKLLARGLALWHGGGEAVPSTDFDPNQERDQQGRWTAGASQGRGSQFISPSVTSKTMGASETALQGQRQLHAQEASKAIDAQVGLHSQDAPVIGAWQDGAENSIMSRVEGSDFDKLKLAVAMKGHLLNQKSVLAFQEDDNGPAALYSYHAKGGLNDIHNGLMQDGVENHTLEPDADGQGAMVHVVDLNGSAMGGVARSAERHDVEVNVQRGHAAFIGDTQFTGSDAEQRGRGRQAYEKAIAESPVQGAAKLWAGIHDHWSPTFEKVRDTQAELARKIADALREMPKPVVQIMTPPKPPKKRERTVVTKHDSKGRILEFERYEVDDADEPA